MTSTVKLYSARVINKGLQTAVQEFQHPNGRVITIVGLVHVAEPEYFAHVMKTVQRLEEDGATVYMEGVNRGVSEEDRASWPTEIQGAHERERRALDIQYSRLPELYDLPWICQANERSALMPYPGTWKASDSNSYDMALLLGPANMGGVGPLAGTYELAKRLKTEDPNGFAYLIRRQHFVRSYLDRWTEYGRSYRVFRSILRNTVGRVMMPLARIFRRTKATNPNAWMMPIMTTYRECIAVVAALKDPGDAVLLWNPGHAEALGRMICRNGFVPQEPSEWLQATHPVANVPQKSSMEATSPSAPEKENAAARSS